MGLTVTKVAVDADTKAAAVPDASAKKKKKVYSSHDLAFWGNAQAMGQWAKYQCMIYDWVATLTDPWGATSVPEYERRIIKTFGKCFGEDSQWEVDEAVIRLTSSSIRSYRSQIGQRALNRVALYLDDDEKFATKQERADEVKRLLKSRAFIFRDSTSKSGPYRSALVLYVFAFHQRIANNLPVTHGTPSGALAFCATAVERALTLWKKGTNPAKSKPNFVRAPWIQPFNKHFEVIDTSSARHWEEIRAITQTFINNGDAEASSSNESDNDGNDGSDGSIQMSDSEAEKE